MDLGGLSGLLFIFINLCLAIFYLTQLIISNKANRVLKNRWMRQHFLDLVNVRSGLLGALIGESFTLAILLILLWWVVHRFGVREKYRLLHIRHLAEDSSSNRFVDNSNTSRLNMLGTVRNSRYLQRLAQVLETYGLSFRRQLRLASEPQRMEMQNVSDTRRQNQAAPADERSRSSRLQTTGDSEMETETLLHDFGIEGGVESATCQWKDPDSVLAHPGDGYASSSQMPNMRTSEIHVIQSIPTRRWSATYSHTVCLLCVYGLIFLSLVVPHCILQIALNVLQQNLAVNFVRLSQSHTKWALNEFVNKTDEDYDIWYTLRDSFGCHTEGNNSYCFQTKEETHLDEYALVHLCAESMRVPDTFEESLPACSPIVYDWIERHKWHSTIRLTVFILSYTICVSLIIRTVTWPIASSTCQTYPRVDWWKGAGYRSLPSSDESKRPGIFGQPLYRCNRSGPWIEGQNHGYCRF
ncbi:unnamed protein product [Echinostoma caproni]|uniref:Uncharacterized protein n=1 Tax=Echinostoma caproni TaxID=27848 RepID=A0A183AUV8_9TREM|nr:unnamed protein product [Echinostoma caproni]